MAEKRLWTGQIWQIVRMELGDKIVFKDNVEKLNLEGEEALAKAEERIEEFLPQPQMLQES